MTEARAWVRHFKRGIEYEVLGQAQIQTETPLADDDLVMIYRGSDGVLWARPTDEFRDGRFAPCVPPAAPGADEVEVVAQAMWGEIDSAATWEDVCSSSPNLRDQYRRQAVAGLAALAPLRAAERERAWREGAEAGMKRAADWITRRGDLTEGTAKAFAADIRGAPLPPTPAREEGE